MLTPFKFDHAVPFHDAAFSVMLMLFSSTVYVNAVATGDVSSILYRIVYLSAVVAASEVKREIGTVTVPVPVVKAVATCAEY